jgi:hypothetical protein
MKYWDAVLYFESTEHQSQMMSTPASYLRDLVQATAYKSSIFTEAFSSFLLFLQASVGIAQKKLVVTASFNVLCS